MSRWPLYLLGVLKVAMELRTDFFCPGAASTGTAARATGPQHRHSSPGIEAAAPAPLGPTGYTTDTAAWASELQQQDLGSGCTLWGSRSAGSKPGC